MAKKYIYYKINTKKPKSNHTIKEKAQIVHGRIFIYLLLLSLKQSMPNDYIFPQHGSSQPY